MTARLLDFKALTFDCYGTLIDWETGIWDALQPLLAANDGPIPDRRAALTTYANIEADRERLEPASLYPDILRQVHREFADTLELRSSTDLDDRFSRSVAHWPAFADTADALRTLKAHFKLVILSNVNRDGFTASQQKLGVAFDAIYTAEDIGSYKPDDANFRYLIDHLKQDFCLQQDDILHTAQSLHHDHVPANRFKLANAWIDRQRLAEGGDWGATREVTERPTVDFHYFSLQAMAEAVRAELGK